VQCSDSFSAGVRSPGPVPLWFLAVAGGPAAGSMRNAADSFLGSLSTLARRLVVTASSNHAHSVADWHLTCAVLFVPTMLIPDTEMRLL